MARPVEYTDESYVYLRPDGNSRLQKFSDRRAIVNLIVDNGGKIKLREIDEFFDFPMREKVIALVRAGWLKMEKDIYQ